MGTFSNCVIAKFTLKNFKPRCNGRVSIQGVKALWGNRVVFPRLGTGDTDRWLIHNLSLSPLPNLGKTTQSPQSHLTLWILTLFGEAVATMKASYAAVL